MRNPIDHLLDDHRIIMAKIESLRVAIEALRNGGDTALAGARPMLEEVGHMMATTLHRHARKEDEALFPALEAIFGTSGTPTAVMREEHRAIHSRAELFRRTLHELNEVEHPKIVAGGAMLRGLAAGGADAAALRQTAEEIVSLLDLHFGKEEDILFPMAREMLSAEDLATIATRIEAIAAEGR